MFCSISEIGYKELDRLKATRCDFYRALRKLDINYYVIELLEIEKGAIIRALQLDKTTKKFVENNEEYTAVPDNIKLKDESIMRDLLSEYFLDYLDDIAICHLHKGSQFYSDNLKESYPYRILFLVNLKDRWERHIELYQPREINGEYIDINDDYYKDLILKKRKVKI